MRASDALLRRLPEAHAADVAAAWQQALEKGTPRQELLLELAGLRLHLTVLGDPLAERLLPSLRHRQTTAPGPADLRLRIWDATATGVPYPAPDAPQLCDVVQFGRRQLLSDARHSALVDHWLGLQAFTDGNGEAWAAYADAGALPEFEGTAPLRNLLQVLLSGHGWHLMHAAMIGRGDRALLLAGPGGSGKSTTACAALLAGWQYGADDLLLFDETGDRVESLYQTVKLRDGGHARLQSALPALRHYRECGEGKAFLYVDEHWSGRLLPRARPVAVLVPQIVDAEGSELRSLDWRHGVEAVLPWTRRALPTLGQRSQLALLACLRRWPVYQLRLGRDPDGILVTLQQALDTRA